MQFNRYIALPKSTLLNQKLFFLIRLVLFAVIAFFLWQNIVVNQKILLDFGAVKMHWQGTDLLLFSLVFLLLPINWGLEALKWQVIAAEHGLLLRQAVKGVVLGLTLDNLLPLGTGAISGRIIGLPNESRIKVIPGILVGQAIQSFITFMFGLFGFWIVWSKASTLFHWASEYGLLIIVVMLILALSLVFWQTKIRHFLSPLWQYPLRSWVEISLYAIGRYMVFSVQFILLAFIFAPETELQLIIGCATWVFAARTFMPKISSIENLGIRAMAVVFFMNLFGQPVAGMLIAVILLWFINLAIPSLIGLVLFKDLKTDSLMK
jgi:hypothetical protein